MTNTASLVASCNNILEKASQVLQSDSTIVPFGVSLDSSDWQTSVNSLVAHRLVSKWYRPNKDYTENLKLQCMLDWIDHEHELSDCKTFVKSDMSPDHWKACSLMRTWLAPYVRELHNLSEGLSFTDIDLEFTPGETYIPNKGKVSIRQKLMAPRWTCTWDMIPLASKLIVNHKTLRLCALEKLDKHKDDPQLRRLWRRAAEGEIPTHEAFRLAVVEFVLKPVNGARASSVEKNNSKRRFINIEPLMNVIYQRLVADVIRRALRDHNNDLGRGQQDHKLLISNPDLATIDLSNASDSNRYDCAEVLLSVACPILWKCVSISRSPTTILRLGSDSSVEMSNFKLSSMGNGFTFELMTLLLLAQGRVFDPSCRVYGDDIIIRNDVAPDYCDLLDTTGWVINSSKTFIRSRFRESCGAFFLDGYGYMKSYDFHWCESLADVIVTCNKLREVIEHGCTLPAIHDAHSALIELVPALYKGPIRDKVVPHFYVKKPFSFHCRDVNSDYVEVLNPIKAYKSSTGSRNLYRKFSHLIGYLREKKLFTSEILGVVMTPIYRPKRACETAREVHDSPTLGMYLYAGRRTDDNIRGKGKWSEIPSIISSDGYICSLSRLRLLWAQYKIFAFCGPQKVVTFDLFKYEFRGPPVEMSMDAAVSLYYRKSH